MLDFLDKLIFTMRRALMRGSPVFILLVASLSVLLVSFLFSQVIRLPRPVELLKSLNDNEGLLFVVPLVLAVIGVASQLMLRYLRSDTDFGTRRPRAEFELFDVAMRVRALEKGVSGLTTEMRDALVADVRKTATEGLADEVDKRLEQRYGAARETLARASYVKTTAHRIVERLQAEIRALMRRGNLNLVLGTATTLAAVAVLAYVALTATLSGNDWRSLLPTYLLRLSVVVFIQIFGFFFLRLYRASLSEIKYFQNEVTNIEVRCLALEYAVLSADLVAATNVTEKLASTERNFVLKKDETTLELEKARLESEHMRELIGQVKDILPWRKDK